ncbi:AcrB/AcrD/AcrF family protein [Sphingomonas sp.]|uniref:AcrB/AcrD/AcrF family protein n=1 Tax=Sphingomonas sp. TaxID=28214 RepID=UPI003CC66D92
MREASNGSRWRRLLADLDGDWKSWLLLIWAAYAAWQLIDSWNLVQWLSLGDTDDNMRLMQVRAWLHGQGWYDLRQYRMDPPRGFDIHWSRLVDLPIAGLILVFRQFTTESWAERLACGIAPLLPLSIALLGLGATVRRLVHPLAWPLAALIFLTATVPMLMFAPERIDHHGWQLALLSLTLAGLTDPQARRGGVTVGLSTAASLAIGLEMLPYGAMAGGILALRWVWDRADADRLRAYAVALGGGSAFGFVAFASNANWVARCDALTPVWLSVTVAAGGLLYLLAAIGPERRGVRLALALAAGAVIVAGFALAFPQCLGRPEQVSDELARNWLANVKEAKPIWQHPLRIGFPIAALPVIGLIGAAVAERVARDRGRAAEWWPPALFAAFAAAMLMWQVRAGPAAALLAVPGATALGWLLLPLLRANRSVLIRVVGPVAVLVVVMAGLFASYAVTWFHVDKPTPVSRKVNAATGDCMRTTRLLTLNRYPRALIFSFVDLGPRIITITHHDAVAGPYHRNGAAILDVQHAFGRSPDEARRIIQAHGAPLLLTCPNMAESTIYRSRNPGGFYDLLARGQTFPWLTRLPMPHNSPYILYRVS